MLPMDALLGPQGWEPLNVFLRVCDSREATDTQVPWFKSLAAPTTLNSYPPYEHPSSRNPDLCVLDSCAVISWERMAVAYSRVAHWVPPGSLELSLFPAPSLPQPLSLFLQSMVTVCVSKRERATEEPWDLRMLADSNYFCR